MFRVHNVRTLGHIGWVYQLNTSSTVSNIIQKYLHTTVLPYFSSTWGAMDLWLHLHLLPLGPCWSIMQFSVVDDQLTLTQACHQVTDLININWRLIRWWTESTESDEVFNTALLTKWNSVLSFQCHSLLVLTAFFISGLSNQHRVSYWTNINIWRWI